MDMNDKSLAYRVFIVRSWKEKVAPDDRIVMRYKLEVPATGDGYIFSSPHTLLDELDARLTDMARPTQDAESH